MEQSFDRRENPLCDNVTVCDSFNYLLEAPFIYYHTVVQLHLVSKVAVRAMIP
jgi:hypothetical protein